MPSASGTVVLDSSVTGPIGNRARPRPGGHADVTTNVTASANTTITAYLTASSRVTRPAGQQVRSVP